VTVPLNRQLSIEAILVSRLILDLRDVNGNSNPAATKSLAFTTAPMDSQGNLSEAFDDLGQIGYSTSLCQPIQSTGTLVACGSDQDFQEERWWRKTQDVEAQDVDADRTYGGEPDSPGMWRCRGIGDEDV
jgi:hypothetical protein